MAANTFVSKLTEECDKCHNFTDHSAIKPLWFEGDVVATHQILGPLFKDKVPEVNIKMLKTYCLTSLFQGHYWSKWESPKPQEAWPSTPIAWAAWVNRMEPYFHSAWKSLGIFDVTKLSTIEISMDWELLMAALTFWCSAINAMVLPLGPIRLTILYMTVILGTHLSGFPVDIALSWYQFNLDLKIVFKERAVKVLKMTTKKKYRKTKWTRCTRISSIIARLSTTLPVEKKKSSRKENTRLSCSTGRISSSFVPSWTSALPRICQWSKPWPAITI